ncbi:hypothetical protein [Sebaldella termitidis]|mgnify:FL=1|uniref:hypothetical protein n=1 Tax=Sebaldella termitidis TaxID=826 RepID=UPI003EBD0924
MRKLILVITIMMSCFILAAKKDNQNLKLPNIEEQMKKADKISDYEAKKDVAWHKTEYNKVLKYLKKNQK